MAKVPSLEIPLDSGREEFERSVAKAFTDLKFLLTNLSPGDNFTAKIWRGTIIPGEEKKIPHGLKRIPSGYLIVRRMGGLIEDGPSNWTDEHAYLRNQSSTSNSIISVLFFL